MFPIECYLLCKISYKVPIPCILCMCLLCVFLWFKLQQVHECNERKFMLFRGIISALFEIDFPIKFTFVEKFLNKVS